VTRSTKYHISKSEIVRQEMIDQNDPLVRAYRLGRFLKATEHKIWRQSTHTGEWMLVDVIENAA